MVVVILWCGGGGKLGVVCVGDKEVTIWPEGDWSLFYMRNRRAGKPLLRWAGMCTLFPCLMCFGNECQGLS